MVRTVVFAKANAEAFDSRKRAKAFCKGLLKGRPFTQIAVEGLMQGGLTEKQHNMYLTRIARNGSVGDVKLLYESMSAVQLEALSHYRKPENDFSMSEDAIAFLVERIESINQGNPKGIIKVCATVAAMALTFPIMAEFAPPSLANAISDSMATLLAAAIVLPFVYILPRSLMELDSLRDLATDILGSGKVNSLRGQEMLAIHVRDSNSAKRLLASGVVHSEEARQTLKSHSTTYL